MVGFFNIHIKKAINNVIIDGNIKNITSVIDLQ